MRTHLDCYPCFVRQAVDAARFAGVDATAQKHAVRTAMEVLGTVDAELDPPRVAGRLYRALRDELGQADPYAQVKEASTKAALELYPWLSERVAASDDPLEAAVRVAIAGSVIDAGPADTAPTAADLWAHTQRVLSAPLAVDDLDALRAELARAPWVLYLADNAGETVFDRVLIETLRLPVTYAVKSGPTLNDATRADALAAGLGSRARIVDVGCAVPGLDLGRCSAEFRRAFATAPVVLAKGQANYESLSEAGHRVFSLLQVTCPVIAGDLGAPVDGVVIRRASTAVLAEV
ncbi:ARMT1-like domain-containing protein [Isoptericola sp. b441]|uniref:ARMT1-like domain-containing protein n=1 Tax=Actinotalea lenta TaxID=3064654 RepID=A0ABT9D972_9CELL|nr:ARMT1-like domain-containing protein [Isoptericola sp. b441]MDO8107016.1 ARMT1-like domain-containing protein [Isoptericola sp. b441]